MNGESRWVAEGPEDELKKMRTANHSYNL